MSSTHTGYSAEQLLAAIRTIELNVDGLNTRGFQQKSETQAALDRIKRICREALREKTS
jgi:hypothetical protein